MAKTVVLLGLLGNARLKGKLLSKSREQKRESAT